MYVCVSACVFMSLVSLWRHGTLFELVRALYPCPEGRARVRFELSADYDHGPGHKAAPLRRKLGSPGSAARSIKRPSELELELPVMATDDDDAPTPTRLEKRQRS